VVAGIPELVPLLPFQRPLEVATSVIGGDLSRPLGLLGDAGRCAVEFNLDSAVESRFEGG